MPIYFDDQPSKISAHITPGFPVSRYDCRKFVWEDALYKGNYCSAYASARGEGDSRERMVRFLDTFRADKSHFNAFELEIDGMILKDFFEFVGQRQEETSEGFLRHTVTLSYPYKKLLVHVCTLVDGSSFLMRWLEIENVGDGAFFVTGLFPMAGILYPEVVGNTFRAEHLRPVVRLGSYLDNHYLGEGEFRWQELPKATLKFGFERALFNPPMYVLQDDVSCQLTMLHIESSTMTQAEFTRCGDYYYARHVTNADYVHFKVGMDRRATRRCVRPGEKVISPKIHIGQIYGDLDTAVNAFNEHLRLSVIPRRNQPLRFPIEYNHGAFTENCQITRQKMWDEVDIAASIGAEMFVVDAGWFGTADGSWFEQRGDWNEHELLENGLCEVFDHAREKGMMCGLWMEAEGINFTSKLAQKHPDWFVRAYGHELPILNLLLPEVEQFVYDTVTGVIDKYRLDLFRIDGGLKEPIDVVGDSGIEGGSWEYFEKLYAIFERIRAEYPQLYLENCSGGGGRSDLGMMRRFDWLQVTDNFAPVAQLRTVYGMTLALAPEQVLSITGAHMRHQTDADFLARSAIFGRPEISGIADVIEHTNTDCLEAWKRALRLYRDELRPMLDTCRVYHHTPLQRYMEKGGWLALELAAPDGGKSFIGLFRLEGEEDERLTVYPRGVSQSSRYRVYSDNSGEALQLSGYALISEGLTVRLPGKLTSEILVCTRIG